MILLFTTSPIYGNICRKTTRLPLIGFPKNYFRQYYVTIHHHRTFIFYLNKFSSCSDINVNDNCKKLFSLSVAISFSTLFFRAFLPLFTEDGAVNRVGNRVGVKDGVLEGGCRFDFNIDRPPAQGLASWP